MHRDVKPPNVLLGQDGAAILADLGIATAADDTRITRMLEKRQKTGEAFKEQLKKREEQQQVLFGAQDLKDWAEPGQRKPLVPADTLLSQEEKDRLKLIGRQTARFANPNTPDYYLPKAYVVADSDLQYNISTYVLAGGNYKLRGEEVKPGVLSAIEGDSKPVDLDGLVGSRRQLLAKWIASRDNPLRQG